VDLVGAHEIRMMLGVSPQRVYQITMHPNFPKPVVVLQQGKVWRTADVKAWIAERRPWLLEGDDESGDTEA